MGISVAGKPIDEYANDFKSSGNKNPSPSWAGLAHPGCEWSFRLSTVEENLPVSCLEALSPVVMDQIHQLKYAQILPTALVEFGQDAFWNKMNKHVWLAKQHPSESTEWSREKNCSFQSSAPAMERGWNLPNVTSYQLEKCPVWKSNHACQHMPTGNLWGQATRLACVFGIAWERELSFLSFQLPVAHHAHKEFAWAAMYAWSISKFHQFCNYQGTLFCGDLSAISSSDQWGQNLGIPLGMHPLSPWIVSQQQVRSYLNHLKWKPVRKHVR